MLTFDPIKHEYKWNDEVVYSCTQYLNMAGLVDARWFTEESRNRGTAVHVATELLDKGRLDESTLHPLIKPYVEAYKLFLVESGFKCDLIEHRVFYAPMRVAGTLDRTGSFNKKKVLIDIKTGTPSAWAKLQTAFYEDCLPERHERYVLQLKATGKYKLHKYSNRSDIKIFQSLVSVVNWGINEKIIKP